MEVFLSTEAIQSFSALQCSLPNTNTDGFLIGHKRGDMFFIERIFPSQKGFFSSQQKYFELRQKLEDKIIGFYSFQINKIEGNDVIIEFIGQRIQNISFIISGLSYVGCLIYLINKNIINKNNILRKYFMYAKKRVILFLKDVISNN